MRSSIVATTLIMSACGLPDAMLGGSPQGEPGDTFVFEVPAGATASGLTPALAEAGLIKGPAPFKLYLKLHPEEGRCLKAGRFEVHTGMTATELLATLCGPAIPEDIPITIVEGLRIDDIDALLASKGLIEPGEYASLARTKSVDMPFETSSPTLEGYLWPETYMIVPDDFTAEDFLERQLSAFKENFLDKYADDFGNRSLEDVVIMASMLEREEPSEANRSVVAGVLWKRLDNQWNLGVDATSRYTIDDWNDRKSFLQQLRDPNDVYNTRLRGGLPPTAIGNPSLISLEAALNPQESPWWYYLHDGSGGFHGAKDAKGHEANRARYNVY